MTASRDSYRVVQQMRTTMEMVYWVNSGVTTKIVKPASVSPNRIGFVFTLRVSTVQRLRRLRRFLQQTVHSNKFPDYENCTHGAWLTFDTGGDRQIHELINLVRGTSELWIMQRFDIWLRCHRPAERSALWE